MKFTLLKPLIVLVVIIVAQLGLQGYRSWAFPVEYKRGDQILTRVFWHNIFSGFAFQPEFADRYKLRIDDVSIVDATKNYLLEKDRTSELHLLGNLETYNVKWSKYDKVVLEMLIDRCREYPLECASAFFYYKPISFFGNIAWVYGFKQYPPDLEVFVSRQFGDSLKQQFIKTSNLMDDKNQRANLLNTIPMLIIVPFLVLFLIHRTDRRYVIESISTLIILFIGSLSTVVIGYPGPHTIAEPAITRRVLK